MARSMFSYRGGARSRGVAGQPTSYGGAPMGSPGQTAMQAFRSEAIGGGQSITSAPSAAPQPARTPSLTPSGTPLPAAPSPAPGSTTPMFKPAFALPNTAMARYVGSLAAQAPAPMQRQAPVAAQPTTVQRAVQATPIGFGQTEAQRQGVGRPVVRAIQNDEPGVVRVTSGSMTPADPEAGFGDPAPTITTDDNGNVLVNGVPITDPNAEGADERSQAQKYNDKAVEIALKEYDQASQQINANQILQALAKAGEQGMRGGMSGFGLGEQGIVQQNALKGQLMASSNLSSALAAAAAQQQSLDRDQYERLQKAYDMNTEEGRAGFARVRRQSEIAQKIQKLQEGGITPEEQAQIATLGAEYAELDAANKAALAKQIGLDKPDDTLNEDGSLNTDKYGGDIQSGVNASADPRVAAELRRKTVDAIKRYFANTRSKYGQNLGDDESVAVTRTLINDLINRSSEGDAVSSAILADLGLGNLINGGFEGPELDDEIDRAMDDAWDEMMSRGDESTYATTQTGEPSLDWYFKRADAPPPTGQLE